MISFFRYLEDRPNFSTPDSLIPTMDLELRLEALNFPPALACSTNVPQKFHQGLFTLGLLYLALYASYDTVSTPFYNTERVIFEEPRVTSTWPVPKASLLEYLLYYTHWLC